MKKTMYLVAAGFMVLTSSTFSQDIPESQVPSIIVNDFKLNFPKAYDVEWEIKGTLYEVDFEIGFSIDHEIQYANTGEMIMHKEDITQNNLPKAIKKTLNTKFKGYRIDDVEKITKGKVITYKIDVEKLNEDWKIIFNDKGEVLSQIAD